MSRTYNRLLATLCALAVAMEIIYVFGLTLPFYLPTHYATPLLDLGKLTNYGVGQGFQFLFIMIELFGLYYVAFRCVYRASQRGVLLSAKRLTILIALCGAAFSITLALAYPYGAADVFDYIFHGRIIAQYLANPFLSSPAQFPGDPLLPYVAWKNLPFTYGPLWAAFSAFLAVLGGDNLLTSLLLYKGMAIAAYLASVLLASSILRRVAPEYVNAGVLLFAWNPLVLTETAANAHNDAVMIAIALAAVRLAVASRSLSGLSVPALVASSLVKFVTGTVAPLFLVFLWRRESSLRAKLWAVSLGLTVGVLLVALSYWPFWSGVSTFAVQRRDELFTASFAALLKLWIESHFGMADAKFVGVAFLGGFAVYALFEAWRVVPKSLALIQSAHRVLLVYLLFACLWFQPWYLIWLVGFAAICPRLDVAQVTMLFSFTAMLNYFVFDYLWIWNADRLDILAVQAIAVGTIYLLPIAYCLVRLWRALPGPAASES